uniref:Uncharacterized protein n=1 Tax=Arundo donax TaxID=35708 RepID=A0A0A9CJR6_ARUDO
MTSRSCKSFSKYLIASLQLSTLTARGGVGLRSLLFKLTSKPTGRQPDAVVQFSSSCCNVTLD